MKKLFGFFILLLLFAPGCSDLDLATIENSGSILPLDELDFDWGDISIDGGDVSHGFHFRNESDDELILKGLETSCMCTTSYIELPDGGISPIFGMYGNSEWTYAVQPGEEFEVEVIFDPLAHGPDAVGVIQRGIILSSSDLGGEVEMTVMTNVMYDEQYQVKYGDGDFVFNEMEFDFGIVKQSSGINTHEFEFTYIGDDPISVTGVPTSCACTSAEISQDSFEKGDKGILSVHFDPNLHEEPEGRFFKTISILTDPELEKQPDVKIWAEMDMDLGADFLTHPGHTDDEH